MSTFELYPKLMDGALRFVSIRPRSTHEVRQWLARTLKRHHTTAPKVEEKVLTRLFELGYLDDASFASWWVAQRQKATPRGERLIRRELAAKGISSEDITQALRTDVDEKDVASRAIEKKYQLWKRLPAPARRKKMWDYLLRRGFSGNVIGAIVDGLMGKAYNDENN
jgi:regulatory protein